MKVKRIKHYKSCHQILLVGEGDFSFALSLATAFGSASNIVATSLDSKESLVRNYSRASKNLDELKNLGCTLVHEVDGHIMNHHPLLKNKLFDRIVFNFPHAGFHGREHEWLQIMLHQEVVSGFLKSARKMLKEDGEVHVTHKTAYPFCNWEIVKLAKKAELSLVEEVPFEIFDYPGYINKRGHGDRCDRSFPVGQCSTFKFSKSDFIFENDVVCILVLFLNIFPHFLCVSEVNTSMDNKYSMQQH
ncbi:uncharacterized protein At4g26485-like [Arachis stenosperma]|uniref:uncharacterized protein At4g26485-like n=1 Tax=Arachis stenosperma TaxID=217475 RepID=UPI0025AD77B4|nr:uncharacterized protein At4g26485-like [Arachis stenosperma]